MKLRIGLPASAPSGNESIGPVSLPLRVRTFRTELNAALELPAQAFQEAQLLERQPANDIELLKTATVAPSPANTPLRRKTDAPALVALLSRGANQVDEAATSRAAPTAARSAGARYADQAGPAAEPKQAAATKHVDLSAPPIGARSAAVPDQRIGLTQQKLAVPGASGVQPKHASSIDPSPDTKLGTAASLWREDLNSPQLLDLRSHKQTSAQTLGEGATKPSAQTQTTSSPDGSAPGESSNLLTAAPQLRRARATAPADHEGPRLAASTRPKPVAGATAPGVQETSSQRVDTGHEAQSLDAGMTAARATATGPEPRSTPVVSGVTAPAARETSKRFAAGHEPRSTPVASGVTAPAPQETSQRFAGHAPTPVASAMTAPAAHEMSKRFAAPRSTPVVSGVTALTVHETSKHFAAGHEPRSTPVASGATALAAHETSKHFAAGHEPRSTPVASGATALAAHETSKRFAAGHEPRSTPVASGVTAPAAHETSKRFAPRPNVPATPSSQVFAEAVTPTTHAPSSQPLAGTTEVPLSTPVGPGSSTASHETSTRFASAHAVQPALDSTAGLLPLSAAETREAKRSAPSADSVRRQRAEPRADPVSERLELKLGAPVEQTAPTSPVVSEQVEPPPRPVIGDIDAFEPHTLVRLSPSLVSEDAPVEAPAPVTHAAAVSLATITPVIDTQPQILKAPAIEMPASAPNGERTKAITLGELAQRRPASEAAEPRKEAESKVDAATRSAPLPPATLERAPEPTAVPAPPPLQVAPPLLEDPSLRVVLLPTVARLSVETQEAGSVSLQLKVHDGVTDIRASGPAASLLESRQGELRVALAREGLALGHFDTQSDSGGRQQRFESPEDREQPLRRPNARPTTSSNRATDGRLSVKA